MSPFDLVRVRVRQLLRRLGTPLSLILLALLLAGIGAVVLFMRVPAPDAGQMEQEIWETWVAHGATTQGGLTIRDLLIEGKPDEAGQLLARYGQMFKDDGRRHAVSTEVRSLTLRDAAGKELPSWRDPGQLGGDWRLSSVALATRDGKPLGRVDIEYRFFHMGTDFNAFQVLRAFMGWHLVARGLVIALLAAVVAGLVLNVLRLRADEDRWRAQQLLIGFGQQMCHELRNGLWVFGNETENVALLCEKVGLFVAGHGAALEQAAARLDPAEARRLRRAFRDALAGQRIDPDQDLAPACSQAQKALHQLQRFHRYMTVTVQELDRTFHEPPPAAGSQPVLLQDAWREVGELLALRFEAAGVTVREEVREADAWIAGDQRLLFHVFMNLAKNALESLREWPGERRIVFRVACVGGRVECVVSNSGPAIPPDVLPNLFQHNFSTKQGAGRGRGLMVVRDCVRRLHGAVSVASPPGEGTAFRLVFPRYGDRGGGPEPHPQPRAPEGSP